MEKKTAERIQFEALSDEAKLFFIINQSRMHAGWTNYIDFEDDFYKALGMRDQETFIATRAEYNVWMYDL